ncbi:MAG: HigA family addiction module antitoxin [Treponema sp.]|nr:HigA family addiction module antitoxin [Treponema sp.]
MQKNDQTPGTTLKALLEKHGMNCNRLAKAINMSNAMVRLLVLDKSPISISAAFRLAKFFNNKPEFWMTLQMKYDLAKAALDKSLAKDISGITDVSNYVFVRKPHAQKEGGKKKAAPAGKRKAAGKTPVAKPARKAPAK